MRPSVYRSEIMTGSESVHSVIRIEQLTISEYVHVQ